MKPDNNQDSFAMWVQTSLDFSKQVRKLEHRANPFSNILNATTKMAEQFPDLLGNRSTAWRLFNSLSGAVLTLLRSCFYWPYGLKLQALSENVDVLIISHLTTKNHLNDKDDFYFGRLEKHLAEIGFLPKRVLINHAKISAQHITKDYAVQVLPAYLSPVNEFGLFFKLLISSFSLNRQRFPSVNSHFLNCARLAQFGHKATGDYRIGKILASLIKDSSVRMIIHTYEGHGWERIVDSVAHCMQNPPRIFGYQHAVLFPGPNSIFQDFKDAMPDHVFTSGSVTKKMFVDNSEMPAEYFSELGSVKSSSAQQNRKLLPLLACLIAPEGSLSEVKKMAEMGIKAAIINPDQDYILRLHPVLRRHDVLKVLSCFKPFPNNFFISEKTLSEDLRRSSWLCYRGSTVAFQGMLSGLRPIYMDFEGRSLFNDPIPEEVSFKRIVNSETELTEIIEKDKSQTCNFVQDYDKAFSFALNYLRPFSNLSLRESVNKLL